MSIDGLVFIRRGANLENVYIDSRGYSGDVNKLLPKSKS